ncbi:MULTISPECIES: CHAT domain-containing protein [unclassified Nocardiopsis]|uniref:CHAT domain-containing protein n=1 Tax=unclassified Nocardiopsis TaxID=2649073 RepID=UPI00135A89EF|nr:MULTISPECIES: CHAT domain-containing protein [unclassified Nocardiopsis]
MSLRAQPDSPVPVRHRPHQIGRTAPDPGRSLLAQVTRGVLLAQDGRFEQTVTLLTDARRRLRGHPLAESAPVVPGLLLNLGLARTLCGHFEQAEEHLWEARFLARERGLPLMDLVVQQNLGCLSLYRGDTSAAIATFHGLAGRLPPDRLGALHTDLAEALLAEGLLEEAAQALADGPWTEGLPSSVSALLVEAKLWLLRGGRRRTVELTRRVRSIVGAHSPWYRLAAHLEGVALYAERDRAHLPVARAREALAVRRPIATPHTRWRAAAHRALDALDALRGTVPPPPGPWLAEACEDPHVVRAGLESALRAGDPAKALDWAELSRSWAVPHVPGPRVRTPSTVRLAERYRRALSPNAVGQGALAQEPTGTALAQRLESARWQAHHESRSARRTGTPSAPGPVADALLERLGGRAFLRYTHAGGRAVALVAVAGRVHSRALGPLPRVARTLARFVHSLRLPGCAPDAHAREAAREASRTLVGPLTPLVGDRSLVVAGDSYLGDPPWGMLPDLRGRPLHLVPTARFWLERASRPAPALPGRVLLVAAHQPPGALREVTALAGLYPRARVLTGRRAGHREVLAALGEADLVHLAGHGHVPDRSPALSSVALHDGPVLACDLAAPPRVPETVVLSTCWSGQGFAGGTGDPLGFVGSLLAAGGRAVVASPVPVPDDGTGTAMHRFHRALAEGAALPEAVAVHLGGLGFCCFGG